MDFNTLLPYLLTSLSTLVVAFVGHTAASMALKAHVKNLLADLRGGHNLSDIQKDVDDLKLVIADIKTVLADKQPAAPNA